MVKPLAVISKGVLDIIPPVITSKEKITNPLRVDTKSPKQHRKAVYKMALYFKRELDYDFVLYDYKSNEADDFHVAYLWIDPDCVDLSVEFRVPCIGATCFRLRKRKNAPSIWGMQWIWLHPYFRRKGFLTASWPKFKEEFPDFICEPPLSNSMISFLKKTDSLKLGADSHDEM